MNIISRLFVLTSIMFFVVACGGGSGGGNNTSPSLVETLTITDSTSGAPVVGAKLKFISVDDAEQAYYTHPNNTTPHFEDSKTSDSNGTLNVVEDYAYMINVEHDDYLPAYFDYVYIFSNGVNDLNLKMNMHLVPSSLSVDNIYYNANELLNNSSSSIGNYSTRKPGLYAFDNLINNENNGNQVGEDWFINSDPEGTNNSLLLERTNAASIDLREFYKLRFDKMVTDIKQTQASLSIWMVYNMGVIIKEGDKVIAIDLDRIELNLIDDNLLNIIDVFLTTHEHKDHFDGYIAKKASELGKPYYIPAYMQTSFANGMWRMHSTLEVKNSQPLQPDDVITIAGGWSIKAIETYHQGTSVHLSYLITSPSGIKIFHTGDGAFTQSLPQPGTLTNIDYLIGAIWQGATVLDNLINTLSVKSFIPAHFNEIGHSASGRYPYSNVEALNNQSKIQILFFGEKAVSSELP